MRHTLIATEISATSSPRNHDDLRPSLLDSCISPPAQKPGPNTQPRAPSSHRLQCIVGCTCRCHSDVSEQVLPEVLKQYLGRLYVPRRILHDFRRLRWECNVQTCRRDKTSILPITWYLPSWLSFFDVTIRPPNLPIYVAIFSPRLVPANSEVWGVIAKSDLQRLRLLIRAKKASVYDVNESGYTVLYVGTIREISTPNHSRAA